MSQESGLEQKVAELRFTGADGKEQRFDEDLTATYADATLVLQNGKVLFDRYHAGMPEDVPYALRTVTKSVVGLLASQLIEEGEPDLKA